MSPAGLREKSNLTFLPKERAPVTWLTMRATSSKALLKVRPNKTFEMSLTAALAEVLNFQQL